MASTSSDIAITVVFRGTSHRVTLQPESTLGDLQDQLEKVTSVSPSLQKLLCKGKNLKQNRSGRETVGSIGLRNGSKVQMLGTTSEELDGMQVTEIEQRRVDRILRERALKAPGYKVLALKVTTALLFTVYRFVRQGRWIALRSITVFMNYYLFRICPTLLQHIISCSVYRRIQPSSISCSSISSLLVY